MEGDRGDGDDVGGDILSHHAIAAGDAILQFALVIDQRHPEAIDFDLAHVIDDILMEDFADFAVKVTHVVFVIGVTQR